MLRLEHELAQLRTEKQLLQKELSSYLAQGLEDELQQSKEIIVKLHNDCEMLNIDNKKLEQMLSLARVELAEQASHFQNQIAFQQIHLKAGAREIEKLQKERQALN